MMRTVVRFGLGKTINPEILPPESSRYNSYQEPGRSLSLPNCGFVMGSQGWGGRLGKGDET
jgi:hypothetical protein